MSVDKKTVYIKFYAGVNAESVNKLMTIVEEQLKLGVEKIVLLISSVGGQVFHGISAYNFLKGIHAEIITHNFGSVDSSAGVIFCAGSKRYSVPHARFLIHGVSFPLQGTFEEKQIEEKLKILRIDTESIIGVFASTTGKSEDEIEQAMTDRTTLSPEQAQKFGLVHEIKVDLVEPGNEIISIVQNQ